MAHLTKRFRVFRRFVKPRTVFLSSRRTDAKSLAFRAENVYHKSSAGTPCRPLPDERAAPLHEEVLAMYYAPDFENDGGSPGSADHCLPPPIVEITLDYTKTLYSPCSGVGSEPIRTAAYFEHLSINRATQTIQLTQEIGPDCTVTCRYEVKEAVGEMLDYFDEIELFSTQYPTGGYFVESPCSSEELVEYPDHTAVYLLHIYRQDGSDRLISGSYDKNGLPEDFEAFIEQVHDFIRFYGTCDIFSPSVYNRLRRRKGELIYCSVRFENSGKTYYYTTEDDSIEIGDLVVVPAGKENLPSVVQVVDIQFFLPEKAPFPPEKAKHILRKYIPEEPDLGS